MEGHRHEKITLRMSALRSCLVLLLPFAARLSSFFCLHPFTFSSLFSLDHCSGTRGLRTAPPCSQMAGHADRAHILRGMEDLIFKIVCDRTPPEQWGELLRAPLEHAAVTANHNLVDRLLKAGANGRAGWRGHHGRTLLHAGAEGGNAQVVSALLRAGAGADKNTKGQLTGRTPLHLAVVGGKEAAAKVLMLAGADVNILDALNDAPLHLAIAGGHVRLACDLLLSGADPNLMFQRSSYPIHLATRLSQYEVVRDLTHKGADVNCLDSLGSSPLFIAVSAGHVSITKVLLNGGADVRAPRPDSMSLLHVAGGWNNPGPIIPLLLRAGLSIDIRNAIGQTALSVSAAVGACEAMLALLRLGADANSKSNQGWTPLHDACSHAFPGAVDLLLRWGADETLTHSQGKTPGEVVPAANQVVAEQVRARLEHVSKLLARAPQDRAWRRRGWIVMCRVRSDRLRRTAVVDGDEVGAQPQKGPIQRARTDGVKLEAVEGGGRGRGAGGGVGGVANADRRAGRDGVDCGGFDGMAAWMMGLANEGLFRKIVGFL